MQGGLLSIQDCDISSTTGSGIASEGGRIEVGGSRIHDCHSHGIAVFSDLDGRAGHLAVALHVKDIEGMNEVITSFQPHQG